MIPMGPLPPIFRAIGAIKTFFQTYNTAIQIALFVAQGVSAHKAAMKAKRTGADILLQKYGTGAGMPVIYGTRRVAGTVVYMNTTNNKELFVVYAIAGHEIDSFDMESLQIDGRTIKDTKIYRQGYDISDGTNRIAVRPSGETRTSGTFWGNTSTERANITGGANTGDNARMTFNLHKGTNAQAADPMLSGIIGEWTSNHKLSGIAYIAANYEYDIQGMFTGIPNLTVVVNGKKLYDPRTTNTTFSSNPALCLLDYLTDDEYGKGLSLTNDIDTSSFSTAANDCDVSADTITHSSVVVERASTTTDRLTIANANEDDYNNFKVGNKFTISDGVTTYVNSKKLIDKDFSLIDIDGTNPVASLQLKFEDGAVGTAITSNTTCTFTETQIRFDCNGVLDTDETVLENTKLLVANMRGIFTYAGGKYSIKVEGTESSVVSLDEDDILESGITLSLENKEAKYNKVEAEFFNAQKKYETDTTYYTGETSDTFLSDDGNEILETRIQLPFCTNQRIAYNHAKALLKRSRSQKTISFVATPKVLKAKVGEVISITNSNLNLSSEQYRITNMVINPDLNIAVNAIEYQTDVYGYVTPPNEEIGIGQDPVDGHRVEAPSALTFTNKNSTTGEAAKLTWTDSSKYPSYEFRVQIIDGVKTRYDRRVKDTTFYLDGISVANGYTAKVSAINALGVESDTTDITVNVTTAPVTTPDIGQGSIGGFNFTATKMYYGTAGNFNNTDTAVYFDNTGQFSLKDKLSWNGTTLNISGNLTVENTISADKILLDGNNLADLFESGDSGSDATLTTNSKIQRFNWVDGLSTTHYGLYIDNTGTYGEIGVGTVSQPSDAIHVRNSGARLRLETPSTGYVRVKGSGTSMELEAGNTGAGYDNTSYILMDIAGNDVAKFHALGGMELPSLTPTTTTNRLYNNAGTLYWNGSQVGVGAINSVTNMADNRILTASGSNSANGEANLTFDGSTLAVTGSLEISADLTVNGTTTTLNTATLDVEDKNITLNYGAGDTSASANGAGITIQDAVDASTDATILWATSGDRFNFSHSLQVPDNQRLRAGTGGDLQVYHDGSNSYIEQQGTGSLIIRNTTDDFDINFQSDDGSGSIATYFQLDGSQVQNKFLKDTVFLDNVKAQFGTAADLQIYHDGSNSFIQDAGTGTLRILSDDVRIMNAAGTEISAQFIQDGEARLKYDNVTKLATKSTGIDVTGTVVADQIDLGDDERVRLGAGQDLQIYHDGSTSYLRNFTGDITLQNDTDNASIFFRTDDGSGGTTPYMRVNGSDELINFHKNSKHMDNVKATFGDSADIQIYHDAAHSYIDNNIGDLRIRGAYVKLQGLNGENMLVGNQNGAVELYHDNSKKFETTSTGIDVTGTAVVDGLTNSGTTTFYGNVTFELAGASVTVDNGNDKIRFDDNIKATFGNGDDLKIFHNGSNTVITHDGTGNLFIRNTTDDADVKIQSDNGSGGQTDYIRCDGSLGQVQLYHYGSEKFITTSTGITVTGAIAETTRGTILDTSGNLTNINNVYASGYRIGSTTVIDSSRNLTNIGTISSGAITSSGNLFAGDNTDINMDASGHGQVRFDGNGYVGAVALGSTTMAIYHNSSSRSLTLGTNETARMVIGGSGGVSFESNNLTSVGTISSGAISATGNVTVRSGNKLVVNRTDNAIGGEISYESGSGWKINDANGDGTRFFIGSSELARFTGSGNFGVGTISPSTNVAVGTSASETIGYGIDWTGGGPGQVASFTANTSTGEVRIGATNSAGTYFPTFYSNGSEAMRIDSSQRVGIGTTAPSGNLHISGGSSKFRLTDTGITDANNNTLVAYAAAQNKFALGVSSTTGTSADLTIDGANNRIGIGTTTPPYKLSVYGGTSDFPALFNSSDNKAGIIISDNDTTSYFGAENGNAYMGLQAGTHANNLNIDSSGRVGIGTTSPASHLDVNGDVTVNDRLNSSGDSDTYLQFHAADSFRVVTGGSQRFSVTNAGTLVLGHPLSISTPNSAEMKFLQTSSSTTASKGSIQWFDSNNNSCGTINLKADGAEDNSGVMEFYVTAQTDELGDDPFSINKMMTITENGVTVHGSLSKTSGSFKIDHPLKPDTHHLVHSFVESPQADNIYSGEIELVDGRAEINLDAEFNMTEGTIVALNRGFRTFTTNESDWDNVKGSVAHNILTIVCQNPESNAKVSWLVIGERQDKEIYESSLTDDHGKVIVEPFKVG